MKYYQNINAGKKWETPGKPFKYIIRSPYA